MIYCIFEMRNIHTKPELTNSERDQKRAKTSKKTSKPEEKSTEIHEEFGLGKK